MTEAHRQIERAAARAKAKKLVLLGYHPVVGLPRHPDGSLRLRFEFAPKGRAEPIESLPVPGRGVWAEMKRMAKSANAVQGELL